MEKKMIVLGDTTNHGGTVVTARGTARQMYIEGKAVACVGDMVYCPKCKGTYPIVTGAPDMDLDGVLIAVEGCWVACKNGGSQLICVGHNRSFHDDGVEPMTPRAKREAEEAEKQKQEAVHADNTPKPFDERVCLDASSVEGLPYCIVMNSGRTVFGRVGANGLLPRIGSEKEGEYTVYWGDDALAMVQKGRR